MASVLTSPVQRDVAAVDHGGLDVPVSSGPGLNPHGQDEVLSLLDWDHHWREEKCEDCQDILPFSLTGLASPVSTEGGHGRLTAVSSDDAEPVRGAVQGETVEVQSDETNPLHHLQDVTAQRPSLAEAGVLLILKTNQQTVRAVTLVEVRISHLEI